MHYKWHHVKYIEVILLYFIVFRRENENDDQILEICQKTETTYFGIMQRKGVLQCYIFLYYKRNVFIYIENQRKVQRSKIIKEYSLSNKWLRVDGGLVVQTFPYKFLTHEGKGEHVRKEKDGKDPIIHCLKNRDLST